MDNYIDSMINALNHSLIRAKYYKDTLDGRFLIESNDWADVARVYMNEISRSNAITESLQDGDISLDFSPIV